jgi:hypothetical protein
MAATPPVMPPVSPSPPPSERWAPHKLAVESLATPTAPPDAHADRVVYGFMQPLLGVRLLFRDRELMRAALLPTAVVAAFCAVVAIVAPSSYRPTAMVRRFYQTFAFLAPLPSFFLAKYYARMAVLARHKLGFSQALPCYEPLGRAIRRAIGQAVLVAIGLVPVTMVLVLVPLSGGIAIKLLGAVWALHWIVVDAFDSTRTLAPGQTLADLDALSLAAPRPWFVRLLEEAAARLPFGGRILSWFARRCDRLALPFREEIALVEAHPSLMVGFALSTAALLATPVLQLLFRPIVLIGAAHVNGRLEHQPPALTDGAGADGSHAANGRHAANGQHAANGPHAPSDTTSHEAATHASEAQSATVAADADTSVAKSGNATDGK